MSNEEKPQFITSIEKALREKRPKREDRYGISVKEINALCDIADRDRSRAIIYAFFYGFEKGKRCERARPKRDRA